MNNEEKIKELKTQVEILKTTLDGQKFIADSVREDYNKLDKNYKELEKQVEEEIKLRKFACEDWAYEDTEIKKICKQHGIKEEWWEEDDCFKSSIDCVEELSQKHSQLKEAITQLLDTSAVITPSNYDDCYVQLECVSKHYDNVYKLLK